MRPRHDLAPLALAAAAGLVGHVVFVRPLVRSLGGPPASVCMAETEVVPPAPFPGPAMVEAPAGSPWVGPFAATGSHPDGWRASFRGRTALTDGALVAVVPAATVSRAPGSSHGALLWARLDLAERAGDDALAVIQAGVPVDLSRRVYAGEAVDLPGLDLALPRVGARALQEHVLMVTLGVRTPGGPSEVQVPVDPALMEAIAVRAAAREAQRRPARVDVGGAVPDAAAATEAPVAPAPAPPVRPGAVAPGD